MNQEKYYHPGLEDLHPGLIYEAQFEEKGEKFWKLCRLPLELDEKSCDQFKINSERFFLNPKTIRIKKLTRADIESFGFKYVDNNKDSMLFEIILDLPGKGASKARLLHVPKSMWILLYNYQKNSTTNIYTGTCRNLMHLARILYDTGWKNAFDYVR